MKASVDLEHKLWHSLESHQLTGQKILVGFSGGVDSLALLWALRNVMKQKVVACYVHHGFSPKDSVREYRQGAANFCQQFCKDHEIAFELRQRKTNCEDSAPAQDQISLHSEEELRTFRYETLLKVKEEVGAETIALAHHQDDLLETRLLRLIRGTGDQGLLAMREFHSGLFRPFLKTSKQSLQSYLKHCSLTAFEDPTNLETTAFRNWLRQEWLPALETRQPGATKSFARSLEVLTETASLRVQEEGDPLTRVFEKPSVLSRLGFASLSKAMQRKALARLAFQQNKRDFTQSHIEEVLKRLDNPQKELMFRVGGLDWCVNAQQITIQS